MTAAQRFLKTEHMQYLSVSCLDTEGLSYLHSFSSLTNYLVGRAVVLLGWRGLVLGWTTENKKTHAAVWWAITTQTCFPSWWNDFPRPVIFFVVPLWSTLRWAKRHLLSIQFVVAVFAVHCYRRPNYGQQQNDSNKGSNDGASSRTFHWKTVAWKSKRRKRRLDFLFHFISLLFLTSCIPSQAATLGISGFCEVAKLQNRTNWGQYCGVASLDLGVRKKAPSWKAKVKGKSFFLYFVSRWPTDPPVMGKFHSLLLSLYALHRQHRHTSEPEIKPW